MGIEQQNIQFIEQLQIGQIFYYSLLSVKQTNLQQYFMNQHFSLEIFKQLRVYRRFSFPLILNDIACNRMMKLSFLVDKAPIIYRGACSLLGKNFINEVLNSTYCRVFTAGNTIQQADKTAQYFRNQGIPVILDYCAEGDIKNPELEATLDENAALFIRSAQQIQHQTHQMISIKITGILDMRILKRWNEAIELRDKFWKENSKQGYLKMKDLDSGLKKLLNNIEKDKIIEYLKTIHNYSGDSGNFKLNELDFKINHHPYYIFNAQKNSNEIIRLFMPLDASDIQKINNFKRRITSICSPHVQNANNFRILIDAEQSYVQKGIQSVSEQLQEQYNLKRAYILPTIQNYLKRSVQRAEYQIQLTKRRNIIFGAKLVRGAYLVEQTKLAKELGYQNPVVECFQKTTQNYLTNYEAIIKNFTEGEVIIASHNSDTLQQVIAIKNKYKNPLTVSFAHLLGLADHLTWSLKNNKYTVYKYLPWAQTEVMVPYMIRRGQQLNQMKYPLDIQYDLLKHQLWSRMFYK